MTTIQAARPTLLGSRFLDFWLVGGFSILVWAFMQATHPLQSNYWAFNRHFVNLPAFSAIMGLFVNYPHFLLSYKLSYGQGISFIRKNPLQLIIVPTILTLILVAAWVFYRDPNLRFPFFSGIWVQGPNFGGILIGELARLMFFTVGWHYSKQIFGIMMVYSKFDGYKLTNLQRNITKASLFGVWFVNYVYYSGYGSQRSYYGVPFQDFNLPDYTRYLASGSFWVAVAAFFYFVIWKKWQEDKSGPPAMFLMPWISLIVWWIPGLIQNDFYIYLVPFFHSLQYLCFVRKSEFVAWSESGHFQKTDTDIFKWSTFYILSLVFIGWAAFEGIPALFDAGTSPIRINGLGFFYIAAGLFINIHHYFIDNVLWRFQTSDVAKRLVR